MFENFQCTGTTGCKRTCASDNLDCYILDNNGFVIISEEMEHTGKFFGQIDGTIMDSLVQDRIYKRITVNDYQGVCSDSDNPYTASGKILQPHKAITWLYNYIVSLSITWLAIFPTPIAAWPQGDYTYTEEHFEEPSYTDEYEPFEEDYTAPDNDEMDAFFTTADVVFIIIYKYTLLSYTVSIVNRNILHSRLNNTSPTMDHVLSLIHIINVDVIYVLICTCYNLND